jgi:hypothetical protein
MSDSIIVSIIAAISSISVAIITVIVKDYLDRKKASAAKEKEETIAESDLQEMVIVHDWLNEVREKYDFERVAIFQFHNGGKFFQGKSMKKFSMTYESVAPGYEKIKRSQQNVLCSEYPHWVSKMVERKVFANVTSEMEHKDRYELEQLGIKQFVTVPIRCLKGHLIGFMVGYNIADIDESIKGKFSALVEDSKFISGYLI